VDSVDFENEEEESLTFDFCSVAASHHHGVTCRRRAVLRNFLAPFVLSQVPVSVIAK